MKIQCPQCLSVYSIDPAKIPGTGARLKCRKCPGVIDVPSANGKKNEETNPDALSEEAIMEKFIRGKDEEGVIQALYGGICDFADNRQFARAEKLREKLMDIAPMALTQIIESGEIIENAKLGAIDDDVLRPWAGLFDTFTKNEIADFYFLLKRLTVRAGQSLFEQGQYDNRLIFIRSGQLKLTYFDNEKKESRDVAILEKGDIAGEDPFFSFTNHTTTLTPIKDSEVYCISRQEFENLLDKHPAVKAKLFDYCSKHRKDFHIDPSKSRVRRTTPRHPVDLKGIIQQIDRKGQPAGDPSSTTIIDMSAGGLCFCLRNLKPDDAQQIHNSWFRITVSYGKGAAEKKITKIAKVVAVRLLPFEECTIHVQFRKSLTDEQVEEFANYAVKK